MMIEFKYSEISDLIFHILAHMKVNNASNLYSEDYIYSISDAKSRNDNLLKEALNLSEYYNKHFERLGIINFLPCYCSSITDLLNVLLTYDNFTEEDKNIFISPLVELIQSEYPFYKNYWHDIHHKLKNKRDNLEEYIKTQISKYEFLFSYFKKSTVIGFSYSLTCNGRGYYQKDTLNAIVPFEIDERKYETTFFQAIHEFTHQFTDEIIGKNINMDDGTHGLSEKAAILFDYYLIKNVYPEDLPSFCRWINKTLNINCYDENSIGHYFPVDSIIKNRLLELINDIREYLSRSEVNG